MNEGGNNISEEGYLAQGFHPSLGGKTARGSLTISSGRATFIYAGGKVELPLDQLTLTPGGNNNEQIFFQHPGQPDWSICTGDARVLQEPEILHNPNFKNAIRRAKKERRAASRTILVLLSFFGIILASLLLLVLQKDRIVRYLAGTIPVEWEKNLGDTLFEGIKKGRTFVFDADALAALNALTAPLILEMPPGYAFRFHILSDTNINAFAIPGGHVVVHTGLLRSAETPEELLGVLAHEVAHVTERHGFRKILNAAGLYLMIQALLGDASGLLAVIGESSEFLINQKFSRDFEREADDVGWTCLLRARIDPRGMTRFFEKLKKEADSGRSSSSALDLISTHPATDERIARMQKKWKDEKNTPLTFKNLTAEFERLKNHPAIKKI